MWEYVDIIQISESCFYIVHSAKFLSVSESCNFTLLQDHAESSVFLMTHFTRVFILGKYSPNVLFVSEFEHPDVTACFVLFSLYLVVVQWEINQTNGLHIRRNWIVAKQSFNSDQSSQSIYTIVDTVSLKANMLMLYQ